VIGSPLIAAEGTTPHWLGYPALGILGYVVSALLGLRVVWDIIHRGRHR
jgi:ubiquinone biosynthesis protein